MPDLAITMTSSPPPPSLVGVTQITFTLDVTNQSDVFATDVKVFQGLDANLDYVSATVVGQPPTVCTGTYAITCSIGSMPGHATARVVVVANVRSQSAYTTSGASVSAVQPDPNPTNNSAGVTYF
jgi:uncharacterized repeat protein (TIGR01451 family)